MKEKSYKRVGILENQQLGGKRFSVDLSGYILYLEARNYRVNTRKAYVRAIESICKDEKVSFMELLRKIDQYVKIYGRDGAKKDEGENGHATWRNALNRLQDFDEYIKIYMK